MINYNATMALGYYLDYDIMFNSYGKHTEIETAKRETSRYNYKHLKLRLFWPPVPIYPLQVNASIWSITWTWIDLWPVVNII